MYLKLHPGKEFNSGSPASLLLQHNAHISKREPIIKSLENMADIVRPWRLGVQFAHSSDGRHHVPLVLVAMAVVRQKLGYLIGRAFAPIPVGASGFAVLVFFHCWLSRLALSFIKCRAFSSERDFHRIHFSSLLSMRFHSCCGNSHLNFRFFFFSLSVVANFSWELRGDEVFSSTENEKKLLLKLTATGIVILVIFCFASLLILLFPATSSGLITRTEHHPINQCSNTVPGFPRLYEHWNAIRD